jgi:hypothetical protein
MKKTKSHCRFLLLVVAIITGMGNIYSQSCPDGLVSYWKMDETSGSTLVDAVSGNNATRRITTGGTQAVDPVTGKVDGAHYYYFNDATEVGEYAVAPDNDIYSFPANSGFTISYWIKWTETQYGIGDGQDHLIISKGDWNYGEPNTAFWASGNNGSGFVSFMLRDDSHLKKDLEGRVWGTDRFNDNIWHHVACVRDGVTDSCIIYVDGRITDAAVVNFNSSFDNSAPVYIGSLTYGGTPMFFYWGAMDELAVYNRALKKGEIDQIRANANLNPAEGLCNLIASPTFNSTPITKATVGEAYSYTAHAQGSAPMAYTLLTKPSGMSIISSTGAISWTPATVDIDAYVQIKADNGIAPADTQSFRIYISEGGASCPSDLMVLYHLNETSGTTYTDYKGAHNATVPGTGTAPSPTTGIVGGAQLFNATTRVDIPDNGSEFEWASNASFSFESWYKTTSSGVAAVSRNRVDLGHVASWWIGVNPNGYPIMELRDNAGTNTVLPGNNKKVNDGQWHHVVGVRDGVANLNKLYVDGVLDTTLSVTFPSDFSSPSPLVVGIGYLTPWSGENELHFIGSIDEVAIFNRAVTSSDVTAFYKSGSPEGHCNSVNYAPVLLSSPITSATEDAAYSYSFVVDDINTTDTLTLSAPVKPVWLNFNWTPGLKTAVLSGTPTNDYVGNNNVTLRVTDGHITRNQVFTISVINSPDAPFITSTAVTSVGRGANYSYTLAVADVDVSDVITMAVVTKPSWITFDWTAGSKTAILTGTPDNTNIGANPVDISISDGHVTIHESYTITVFQTNEAPIITGQSALNMIENENITILKSDLTITDADNSQSDLTIKVRSGDNYTFSGNIVTPALDFTGLLTVNIRAYDLLDSSAVYPLIISVVKEDPAFTSFPDTTATVGKPYIYILTTNKDDDPNLVKSVVSKPGWLNFTLIPSILSGVPKVGDIGKRQVVISLNDGNATVYQIFNITVSASSAINEVKESEFVIYPVPVKDELNIRFNNIADETVIEIINSTGSMVESMMVPANTDIATIPMDRFGAGFYICHIKNNSINLTSRFLIVR